MTERNHSIAKPLIAALSLGVTVGGWAVLARQAMRSNNAVVTQLQGQATIVQNGVYQLPLVPTAAALNAYGSPSATGGDPLNLPQASVQSTPVPQRLVPPVTTTQSSR